MSRRAGWELRARLLKRPSATRSAASLSAKPIAEYQTIQIKLADMATQIEASRLLIYSAAEKTDRGERCDLEAGMAKLFATETAAEVSFEAMRILGAQRLFERFPGGTLLSRRAAGSDRRRHERTAAADHRTQSAQEIQGGRLATELRALLRGIRSRRGLQALARPHHHRIRQHLVRSAFDEPESSFHRRALRAHATSRTAAGARYADLQSDRRDERCRYQRQNHRQSGL